MVRFVRVVPVALVVLAASGCSDRDVRPLAAALQRALGVKVRLKAAHDDHCLALQLIKLRTEYGALTDFSRERVRHWVKDNVSSIELQPTQAPQGEAPATQVTLAPDGTLVVAAQSTGYRTVRADSFQTLQASDGGASKPEVKCGRMIGLTDLLGIGGVFSSDDARSGD